jgi:5-bromo-4-chloroindolyl phosphate hydrolysis protein
MFYNGSEFLLLLLASLLNVAGFSTAVIISDVNGVVAEAYTTQPNSKASSRVLYMYFS